MAYPYQHENFDTGSWPPATMTDPGAAFKYDTTSKGTSGPNSITPNASGYHFGWTASNDPNGGNCSVAYYYLVGGSTGLGQWALVRGDGQDRPTSSCYFAVMSATGLSFYKCVAGTLTQLTTPGQTGVALDITKHHLLQIWINGTTLTACLVRTSDGFFFSNTGGAGTFVSTPTYITVTDSTFPAAAGKCGFANPGTVSPSYSDDFYVDAPVASIDFPTFTLGSVGATKQLTAGGFTDPMNGVTWSSGTPAVATVSAAGLVTAVAAGTATITATGKRDTTQTATAAATVSTAAPTTATLSAGSTSGPVNTPSSAFTITLDHPVQSGNVVVTVTDSVGGDTVTTSPVTIATGQSMGTFTITPTTTGARPISITTSPVLTYAGTPITYTATAAATGSYYSTVGGFASGLVGTVGYTVLKPDGTPYAARTPAGVVSLGGGNYGAMVQVPFSTGYTVVWDNGSGLTASPDTPPLVPIEPSGLNVAQAIADLHAVLCGISAAGQTKYYAPDGTTQRVAATFTGSDRTAITLTPPT
jgi:hypothetical protein